MKLRWVTIFEMDSEEDPIAVLEQMLANKGKRRAPGKNLTPKKKPTVKRKVQTIDDKFKNAETTRMI